MGSARCDAPCSTAPPSTRSHRTSSCSRGSRSCSSAPAWFCSRGHCGTRGVPAPWHSTKGHGAMAVTRSLLSREAQLLVLTAGGPANEAPLRRLLDAELDWGKFAQLAHQERATAIVWRWLQRAGARRVPIDVEAVWRKRAMVSEFQALRLEHALHETVDLLAARGIDVMLLKGS